MNFSRATSALPIAMAVSALVALWANSGCDSGWQRVLAVSIPFFSSAAPGESCTPPPPPGPAAEEEPPAQYGEYPALYGSEQGDD